MYAMIKSYIFVMGEQPLYSWRIESRIKKARHDPRMDKYGRRSRRSQSDNRRLPCVEQSGIIGVVMEIVSL